MTKAAVFVGGYVTFGCRACGEQHTFKFAGEGAVCSWNSSKDAPTFRTPLEFKTGCRMTIEDGFASMALDSAHRPGALLELPELELA